MSEPVIKVVDVSKVFKLPHNKKTTLKSAFIDMFRRDGYERQQALKKVSIEVNQGEFFGIIGRNGSGKSTLLKILAGIYSPTKGDVSVEGKLTPFIELGVGFNHELTGKENIFLNGALLGFSRSEMEDMYEDIVKFAELERFMDQKLKNYSSGMQVRLAFSIAIRVKSDILLIDEVLAVGDQNFQKKCFKVFEDIKKQGTTVIFISHDSGVIERFCDRVALIDRGKLINIGAAKDIVLQYGAMMAGLNYKATKHEDHKRQHIGTGHVIVESVDILNKNRESVNSLKVGEKFSLDIKYTVKKKLPTDVVVGVAIVDDQGVSILGPNTTTTEEKALSIKKSGVITVEFPGVALAPKTYSITVGFYDKDSTLSYDYIEEVAEFTVLGEQISGKIKVQPKWTIRT